MISTGVNVITVHSPPLDYSFQDIQELDVRVWGELVILVRYSVWQQEMPTCAHLQGRKRGTFTTPYNV